MVASLPEWIFDNRIEITGALLGVLYIFFSVRQNILTWPVGLLSSVFYIFVFLKSGFYAYMSLQVYYVIISIYGWFYWLKGSRDGDDTKKVKKVTNRLTVLLVFIAMILYGTILLILLKFTDSPVPFIDSLISALSIVATWMLSRKILENWLVWIFVDVVSIGLFILRDLWPTAILYMIYAIFAISGFMKWKKTIAQNG